MRRYGKRPRMTCEACGKDVAKNTTIGHERAHKCPHGNYCVGSPNGPCTDCKSRVELRRTRVFLQIRMVRKRLRTEADRFVAELWSRGTTTLMYKSKAVSTEKDAQRLAAKYLKCSPQLELM